MATSQDTLRYGLEKLALDDQDQDNRARWASGDHPDLPYAPEGVSREYLDLREESRLPLIRLALRLPIQRLRVEAVSIENDPQGETAIEVWKNVWRANGMQSRQRVPYFDALVHDCGVVGVWPNKQKAERPIVRVESPRFVHVEHDPSDPFRSLWAVKSWIETPDLANPGDKRRVAMLYTPKTVERFVASGEFGSNWQRVATARNPLARVPFVTFAPEFDSRGLGTNLVDALIPMQRNIDTMRFFLNLAANFAAFRQRIATGYDPVVRDSKGDPVYHLDSNGEPVLDANGFPTPLVRSPGKVGVDRMLVFPGVDTKVFDLEESDLKNYVSALDMLYSTFAAAAQVPAQYLVGDFKNVSGDLLSATDTTLLTHIEDLQTAFGESIKHVIDLANIARGRSDLVVDEVQWADAAPVSLGIIGDFVSKAVPSGWPLEDAMSRAPGMTPQKLADAMESAQSALQRAVTGDLAAALTGPKPDAATE